MLESLYVTKSKIRRDLLTLFFTNPSKSYYTRQIERLLGHSVGSISRELKKFKQDNLLLTERVGNLVFYKLNHQHPLYNELKNIIMKTSGIFQRIREALSEFNDLEVAFIYGSFAKDKQRVSSDIDLMIIGNVDSSEIASCLTDLEMKFGRDINFTLYTKSEFKQKKNKIEFLKNILTEDKIFLIGTINDLQ
ncbi:MAG: hypothetical protein APR63_12425 [Desulfuromonas sp. SDB]|nr:MAG: hypothetical protein APR63_12425 [Desulfuromonas sp. SDB]